MFVVPPNPEVVAFKVASALCQGRRVKAKKNAEKAVAASQVGARHPQRTAGPVPSDNQRPDSPSTTPPGTQ